MHPGIAPVAIVVVARQRRTRTAQFEQAGAGFQGDLGGQHLGLGHCHRGTRHRVFIRGRAHAVHDFSSTFEQSFGGIQLNAQLADLDDRQRIITGLVQTRVDPRPRMFANKNQSVAQSRTGNTGVDGRCSDLRKGPGQGRVFIGAPGLENVEVGYQQILHQHRATGRIALADARPVVHHGQPGTAARHKGQVCPALVIQRQHPKPVGIQ